MNENMNIKIYNILIKKYITLKELFCAKNIECCDIDNNLIYLLKDDNIKNLAKNIYSKIILKNMKIITILDLEYPKILINKYNEDIPFCIICEHNINFNNKNVYIYFNKYFSKYGLNIINCFSKIINNKKCNVISKYNDQNIKCINLIDINDNKELKGIVLSNKRYLENFFEIIDFLIVIEAQYENEIVKLIDIFLNKNKDIYVVPANIFNKNSYFSNYLIKQGADIILNRQDLKFILSKKRIY